MWQKEESERRGRERGERDVGSDSVGLWSLTSKEFLFSVISAPIISGYYIGTKIQNVLMAHNKDGHKNMAAL